MCRTTALGPAPAQVAKFLTRGEVDYQWLVDESRENLPKGARGAGAAAAQAGRSRVGRERWRGDASIATPLCRRHVHTASAAGPLSATHPSHQAELDFLHEAANSARCAANLASRCSRVRGRVAVPAVDLGRTSHRVLTMEFVEGG